MVRKLISYDIHGEVSVVSEVALPELERFRTPSLDQAPTIRVSIPRKGAPWVVGPDESAQADSGRRVQYHDGLGRMGFGMEVVYREDGQTIEIQASPLLARSPHVLYTNIVEPVLRWTFVEKGFALVHGACVAIDDRAYLITARTDTGKTTTILRLLDNYSRFTFLSDDLTLLRPDGSVLAYPKPLTISAHTVVAVNSPLLTRRERMTLPLQSRLHSKSGRFFGMLLAKTRLPMATMNAIIQLLVPPPKYHVDRLVPHAMTAGQPARLAGMFVIERGEDGEEQLTEGQAVQILLENCDDAYGFPPYADIKHVLHRTGEHDLRPVEQSVVTGAFAGLPAVLLRSSTRDWWKLIPAHIEMDHQTPGRNGSVRDESLATISPMYAEAPALLTAEPEPLSAD